MFFRQRRRNAELITWAQAGDAARVKTLLHAGADVHASEDLALEWAAYCGHTATVKVLLDGGADVHANDDGALRWAAKQGTPEPSGLCSRPEPMSTPRITTCCGGNSQPCQTAPKS